MKTVRISKRMEKNRETLHIEAPGCVINITPGLVGAGCRNVTSVEIVCDRYAGEQHWYMPDLDADNPPHATNIRVVQETEEDAKSRKARP